MLNLPGNPPLMAPCATSWLWRYFRPSKADLNSCFPNVLAPCRNMSVLELSAYTMQSCGKVKSFWRIWIIQPGIITTWTLKLQALPLVATEPDKDLGSLVCVCVWLLGGGKEGRVGNLICLWFCQTEVIPPRTLCSFQTNHSKMGRMWYVARWLVGAPVPYTVLALTSSLLLLLLLLLLQPPPPGRPLPLPLRTSTTITTPTPTHPQPTIPPGKGAQHHCILWVIYDSSVKLSILWVTSSSLAD